jgi:tetratricopeptide (TPR) repeat protein
MYFTLRSAGRLVAVLAFFGALQSSSAFGGQEAAEAPAQAVEITADNIPQLLERGGELMSQGAYEQALELFMRISQSPAMVTRRSDPTKYPNDDSDIRARIGIGMAFTALQEYESALESFNEILESYEEYPAALIGRGNLYLAMGDPGRALPDFQKAVKFARRYPGVMVDALFGLGKSLVLTGQVDQAIGPLSKVIAAGPSPNLAEALRLRGSAYGGLDKFVQADADLKQSLSLKSDSYETLFEIGLLRVRQKEYQAAIDEFARSIQNYKPQPGREDEPYAQGYLLKASAHLELGKASTDEATRQAAYLASIEESQKLYSLVDENSRYTAGIRAVALMQRGIGERMAGKLNDAIRTFSQALELNPAASEAYFRRGICLLAIGENQMAIADFVQAAAINYEDPRNNLWEGIVYAKMGNYHEAIRAYGDAIAASDRFTPAYINRGLAYMMLKEDEKAIRDFDEALRIEPTNGDYFFKRGVAYAQLNRLEEASNSLASAIEFAPEHREAYRQMAAVQQQLGRKDLAEQYQKKATDLDKVKSVE